MNALDHELIDLYLAGEMDGEALQQFEQRLSSEPSLRKALDTQRELIVSLRRDLYPDANQAAFLRTLEKHRHDITHIPHMKAQRVPGWVIAAASVAAIIAGTLFLSPWQKNLYKEFVSISMNAPVERGANERAELQEAAALFNDSEYAAAIPLLDRALAADSTDAYARFYRGVSLLEINKIKEARIDLKQIYEGNSLFKYDGAFYMALTYLKSDDKVQCRTWLNKIPADAANYQRAQHLLKAL